MLFLDKYYKSKTQSNFKFSDNSIYKPGDEWKEIMPGQKIPSVNKILILQGLYIRIDLSTGKRIGRKIKYINDECVYETISNI